MDEYYFLVMIQNLRQHEEIILYANLLEEIPGENEKVQSFLEKEFEREATEYPGEIPAFDREAALWAARTIYIAAQLTLYRENKESDLSALLPEFQLPGTPSAALSADLCLRFLPEMIGELKAIDREDGLIALLEDHLRNWPYSAVTYSAEPDPLSLEILVADNCLRQLYINRVIAAKNLELARHPLLNHFVKADLGIFENEFWMELKTQHLHE